ncbi:MAG: excinuclease ABC subunit UvrC [Lachnospiraceae bacterium]|nr:excinuclease ABC subunit UvrC [Lachnospiraceae bacterium]
MNKKDFSEDLSKLPDKPGVYIMRDENDTVIYVGKAVSLKNRVRQYFRPSHNEGIRKDRLVEHIDHFDYIVTDSELEALVLECNFIKEHRPKYNTLLRDDKTYPFIKVTLGEKYPRILFTREIKNDKSKYFGPFTSAYAVKDTITFLRKVYKIRTCNSLKVDRQCLDYHINQCFGVCMSDEHYDEYMRNVNKAVEFLKGNHKKTMDMLTAKMDAAAAELDFEKAAEYRDLMESIRSCIERQKITSADNEDADVIAKYTLEEESVIYIMFIRGGKLLGSDHFYFAEENVDATESLMYTFIKQFYDGALTIPREIYVDEELDNSLLLEEYLNETSHNAEAFDTEVSDNVAPNRTIHIITPKIGKKRHLIDMAKANAKEILEKNREKIVREMGRTIGALKEISNLLHISKIDRMEAYDISNISGYDSVGSMVVFEGGRPKRNDYRKFRIKTIDGPNDYGSMKEVLTRRFKRAVSGSEEAEGFSKLPDIIMMDGGAGQVNVACEVLDEIGLDIPVAGMVKDDHHNTRGLIYNGEEIDIDTTSEGFKLITRLQDEAHRFAITYHKSLRGKGMVHSILDDIEGIGPKRRKALMKYFQDLESIKNASVEDLEAVEGLDKRSAENVYAFFHK